MLLTGEPQLVSLSARLLLTVLRHNQDALAALYRTGLFFFALLYCGSDLREVAALLHAAHLKQVSLHGRREIVRSVRRGFARPNLATPRT